VPVFHCPHQRQGSFSTVPNRSSFLCDPPLCPVRLFARPSPPETPRLTHSLALFHESLWIISIPFQQMPPPHRAAIANETHYQTSFRRLWTNHGLSISIEMWWARYFCKFRGVLSASLNRLLEVGTERRSSLVVDGQE
ncbi:hypothetical protein CMEL01_01123, partial [Colletotrichum melonis]